MSSPFAPIIKAHKKKHNETRAELDIAKVEVTKSVEQVTASTFSEISQASLIIDTNQKKLETDTQNMALMADNFHRRTVAWTASYLSLNEALKQLGDVAQWTKVIETDMTFISKVLDNTAEIHNNTHHPVDKK